MNITRRRLLQMAAGTGAATSALGSIVSRSGAQAAELVVASSSDPGHLDPRVEAGVPGWAMFQHMFDGFVWRNERTEPIPALVIKWEQVNPTTLRWTLRRGVKFHNGEEFTAESVKLTIEQIAAPASRHPSRPRLQAIREMKIQDAYTIDLITERPNRPLLRNSTSIHGMSPKALRELGDKFGTNPVGTGPYKFVEYRPGQHVIMEANAGYWGKKPTFARIRYRFIPENGTRIAALEAGEVMLVNNVPPDQLPRLRNNPNLRVVVSPTYRVMFVGLRCDRAPFSDKRVRQAMNYAVDREALTKGVMGGLAPISRAPLPDGIFGFNPNLPPYKYDPERAKKLLAEAGASGATVNMGVPVGRYLLDKQVGEAVAGYLEEVGLKVKLETAAWSTYISEVTKYEKSKYDAFMFGYAPTTGEPDHLIGDHFYSKAPKRTLYNNPEVDRLIVETRESFDTAKVQAAYGKLQEIVWDECPWIFLYEQPDINAINKKLKWTGGRRDEYVLFHDATLE
jgi:peptide/nickel transport system substrate-binding protein